MIKLSAKELRLKKTSEEERKLIRKNPVYIILDNVLDTYNIGAVFRLADAVAASKVYLCAGSETPPNHRIKKASINTTEWVEWEYCDTAIEAIQKMRQEFSIPQGHFATSSNNYSSSEGAERPNREVMVVAIEQAEGSVAYDEVDYTFPVALVVGHETDGVSKETLKACDKIVELPMWGVNISLNVMVSLGIVLFKVMESYEQAS